MFAFIPLFVDFVHYLTFWHHKIQTYRFSHIKSVVYFVCSICHYGIDKGIISSVEGIWLDVPLMRSLFILHNFYATARKTIYAACYTNYTILASNQSTTAYTVEAIHSKTVVL